MFNVCTGQYYESHPASQCHTSSTFYPEDAVDNPIFGGGRFFNDGSLMTGDECREACDDASNVDDYGRPCVPMNILVKTPMTWPNVHLHGHANL